MKTIMKIIICGFIFFYIVGLRINYELKRAHATSAEICDQALVGQKFEFKKLIEKYEGKGVKFYFRKDNGQTKMWSGKTLDAEDVAVLTDMTGHFTFEIHKGFVNYKCWINLKNGIIESKWLPSFVS